MRCLAIAEELSRSGADVVWILNSDPIPWVSRLLRERGWTTVVTIQGAEAAEMAHLEPDAVVLDSYCLDPQVTRDIRSTGIPVVALVDDVTPAYEADLYVAPALGTEWSAPCPDTPYLKGLDYVLIRDELRDLGPLTARTHRDGPLHVACLFGGTDTRGVAPRVVSALTALDFPMTIEVVPESAALPRMESRFLDGYVIHGHSPGRDFTRIAVAADLVISAAGVSSWELLYLGVELALIQVADNQDANYREMTERGWAVGLGSVEDWPSVESALRGLVANWRPGQAPPGSRGTDGRGAERVVSWIRHITSASAV
jgi:spore coat polysaccharide biosynthesis predicted glycosyltransferase SpsG